MEKYERIRDEEVFQVIKALVKNDTSSEEIVKEVMITKLKLLGDIRQFLRKIYKNIPKRTKIYKRPTGKKEDIIVGDTNSSSGGTK